MDDELCGDKFEIDSVNIMAWGKEEPVLRREGFTLACTLRRDHTPNNVHSDGVTTWRDV